MVLTGSLQESAIVEINSLSICDDRLAVSNKDKSPEPATNALSKAEEVTGEVIILSPKVSPFTHALLQVAAGMSQVNENDIAMHLKDHELLSDYINLIENHKALQLLVNSYMSRNMKLNQELELLKVKHSKMTHELKDSTALQISHDQLEQRLSESRLENIKLANQNTENLSELCAMRSDLSNLQKQLEIAQGCEQRLHLKLKSFYDASQAIKMIEQSLLPHGSKKGIGYVTVPNTTSTSVGVRFTPAITDIPRKPMADSVYTDKGKEKEVSNDSPKAISKSQRRNRQKKVNTIDVSYPECSRSKLRSQAICKSRQNRSSRTPNSYHPHSWQLVEDEAPSAFTFHRHNCNGDNAQRMRTNDLRTKKISQSSPIEKHTFLCSCKTHSCNTEDDQSSSWSEADSCLKTAKTKNKCANSYGPRFKWVPKMQS